MANVADYFADLTRFDREVPLKQIDEFLRTTDIPLEDVHRFTRFHPDRYLRNLMFSSPAFQALVLCWRNGQRSPIHDHIGSNCGVKVLVGNFVETQFELAPNRMVYAISSSMVGEGGVTVSTDSDIHQISNLQSESRDLITLHIYSPPLLAMNVYSLYDDVVRSYDDPINEEFFDGAGI
ncbi:MAG TPA: hypothetical protein EYG57_04365 [Planctomycetes bacterium]|nr:hypothetical protein [Planctomycetota bacterium]